MANDQFAWTPQLVRCMLDFVNENLSKNSKRQWDGVKQHVENNHDFKGKQTPTSDRIRVKLTDLANTTSKKQNGLDSLLRTGVRSLDLNHVLLKNVYTKKEINNFASDATSVSRAKPSALVKKTAAIKRRKPSLKEVDDDDSAEADNQPLASLASVKGAEDNEPISVSDDDETSKPSKRRKLTSQINDTKEKSTAQSRSSSITSKAVASTAKSTDAVADGTVSNQASLEAGSSEKMAAVGEPLFTIDSDGPYPKITGAEHPEKTMHELTTDIEDAVDKLLKHLELKSDQPLVIRSRKWNVDLEQLMRAVFGNKTEPDELDRRLTRMAFHHKRALSLYLFLRSAVAAAINTWVMLPDPSGTAWTVELGSHTSDGRTLDAFYEVLVAHATTPQINKFRHLVAQKAVGELLDEGHEDNRKEEVLKRATLLSQKLYTALSPLFAPEELGSYDRAMNNEQYFPLADDRSTRRVNQQNPEPFPTVRSFQVSDQNRMSSTFQLEMPRFQKDLIAIFESALKFRMEMVKRYDAEYAFDFPHMGMRYPGALR